MEEIKKLLGDKLKVLRKKRGWSLDEAALITGVSKAMLGQIERGESNPSVGTIWKIANGFKVSFSSLLTPSFQQVRVIKSDSIDVLLEDDGKYRVYPIFTYDPLRQWESFTIELDPGCSYQSDSHGDEVEEYITVTKGAIHLTIQGEEYELREKDAIHFRADTIHHYQNKSAELAVCQLVIHYKEK
ncbi:helix-turn-helix domain-containing protein [Jeotgalibacillus proteolyticus]|uniref:DNA-binding protein n=1 Tax=Jeotgalibacillus proteolyticus TaxID=2082395 RepID=A0A2S5GHF5_9BACL|nr:XRE family transcriptional regulator [Jeotgalibacillus proteolyticus]PPA72388.1 DNA-binding protein [Jeotgalibacillus proteolyticus]